MLKVCGLVFAAMLMVFTLIVPANAGPFQGEWVGHWENSLGEGGHDSLSLYESRDGTLRGTWSGNVEVHGAATGRDSIRLHGRRNDGVTYDITAEMHHGDVELHYSARRPNGSTYDGWAKFHRR